MNCVKVDVKLFNPPKPDGLADWYPDNNITFGRLMDGPCVIGANRSIVADAEGCEGGNNIGIGNLACQIKAIWI